MKKIRRFLCLVLTAVIFLSSFNITQVSAASKLKNGIYYTCHYAEKKAEYKETEDDSFSRPCCYKAGIRDGKLTIYGGLYKIKKSYDVEPQSKTKYAKRTFKLTKSCKIYDGSDYSYEIGEYEKAELSKKDFNNVFNNKYPNKLELEIHIKNNKITQIICMS